MSYILQALKRSESEQRAPQLPGISTEQNSEIMFIDDTPARPLWLPVLVGAGLVSAAVLLGMWWMLHVTGMTGVSPAAASAPISAQTVTPTSAVELSSVAEDMRVVGKREVTKAAASPNWPPAEVVKRVVAPPLPASVEPALPAEPAPTVDLERTEPDLPAADGLGDGGKGSDGQALRESIDQQVLLARVQAAVAATQSMNTEGLDPLMPSHVAPLADKSEALQKAVPSLSFSQHIYSSEADKRWVKVNGESYYEGQHIAGGVILERIDPQSVVLSLNGEYFSLPALADW